MLQLRMAAIAAPLRTPLKVDAETASEEGDLGNEVVSALQRFPVSQTGRRQPDGPILVAQGNAHASHGNTDSRYFHPLILNGRVEQDMLQRQVHVGNQRDLYGNGPPVEPLRTFPLPAEPALNRDAAEEIVATQHAKALPLGFHGVAVIAADREPRIAKLAFHEV